MGRKLRLFFGAFHVRGRHEEGFRCILELTTEYGVGCLIRGPLQVVRGCSVISERYAMQLGME